MPSKLTLALSLALSLMTSSSAMAQDLSGVEGLESAYGRMYMVDTATIVATPGATESLDAGDIPLVARTAVYSFEDSAAAEVATEDVADSIADDASEGAGMEKEELDGIGDAAFQYTTDVEVEEGTTVGMVIVVVQEDENLLVAAVVGGEDPAGMAHDWAEFMVDAEIENDEVQFSEDGTSSGGAFDLMPGADDEDLLGDLAPVGDVDVIEEKGA